MIVLSGGAEVGINQHFRKIAVYGMRYIGQRLIEELRGSRVSVAYGIERNIGRYLHTKLMNPDDTILFEY